MNCQHFELDIDDYVDERLDPRRRAPLEEHLRTCAPCRALVADLRTLCAAIETLEPQRPSPQLWARIAAGLESERRSDPISRWLGLAAINWRLAMSTAMLVCVLVGGMWIAFRDAAFDSRPMPHTAQAAAPTLPLLPSDTGVDAAASEYASAITSLERIADTDTDALDTSTAAVVRKNLAVLDTAIGESRRALDTNPSSEVARDSLLEALRSKVALLQDTVTLINDARSEGEGRTRIDSGTDQ